MIWFTRQSKHGSVEVGEKEIAQKDHRNPTVYVIEDFWLNGEVSLDAVASSQEQDAKDVHVPCELCELVKSAQDFWKVRIAVEVGMNAHDA